MPRTEPGTVLTCINISTHAVQCLCPAKVLCQFQQVLYLQSVSMRSLIKQSEWPQHLAGHLGSWDGWRLPRRYFPSKVNFFWDFFNSHSSVPQRKWPVMSHRGSWGWGLVSVIFLQGVDAHVGNGQIKSSCLGPCSHCRFSHLVFLSNSRNHLTKL